MEISMLPIHALSIRTCATMFPPSSATAMFMGWPISLAFFSAALITRRASSNFTAVIGSPLCVMWRLQIGELAEQIVVLPALSPVNRIIGSRLSLQLARSSLRLFSGEKALARDWREQ